MSTIGLPDTPQAMDEGLTLVVPGRGLSIGAGWSWVVAGWRLFVRAPLMWIISLVLLLVIAIAMNLVPLVGGIAYQLLQAVFAAGFVAACRSLERGGDFELEHLFAGFTRRFGSLLVVGALVLAGWIVIGLVVVLIIGFSIFGAMAAGGASGFLEALVGSAAMLLVGMLVGLLLAVPLMAAYWFAPALVLMHDMPPVAAMKASFGASIRNMLPFLLYSVVMMVPVILISIPAAFDQHSVSLGAAIVAGLGMLVWLPLLIASSYAAYRQIFTADTGAAVPARATMV